MLKRNFFSQPTTLWILSALFIPVTYAFGTINSLLVLYLTKQLHVSTQHAYAFFAAFNSMVFTLPIIIGYAADKLGHKLLTHIGLWFSVGGAILLATSNIANYYFGVALVGVGITICATTAYCMIDASYTKQDTRRESGFTIFYLVYNIGFLISSITGGYIARYFGYHAAFWVATIVILLACIGFQLFQGRIQTCVQKKSKTSPTKAYKINFLKAASISTALVVACMIILKFNQLADVLLWTLITAAIASIIYLALKQKTRLAQFKLLAFLLLSIVSIAFWALYLLEPSLLTVFVADNVNRHVLNMNIPASAYFGLDAFYVVVLGMVLSWLWHFLNKRNKNISLPTKFALALITMGTGYWIINTGIRYVNHNHLVGSEWIILAYALFATAELLISPIGLAMAGRLAPRGKEGFLIGVWQLFMGFASIVSGYFARFAIVPKTGTPFNTNPIYSHAFYQIGAIAVICGLVTVALIPLIKHLITTKDAIKIKTVNPVLKSKHEWAWLHLKILK